MKIFTIFFASYLMVLSFLPCGDSISINLVNTTSTVMHQTQNHEENHHDVCSPFCACNCCRVTADIAYEPMILESFEAISFLNIKIPERDYSLVTLFDQNIWQPPKITV